MPSYITCSWCHTENPTTEQWCQECGHRADRPRMTCDCPLCRPSASAGHALDSYYFDGAWRVRCSCGFRYSTIDAGAAGRAAAEHERAVAASPGEQAIAEAERIIRGE